MATERTSNNNTLQNHFSGRFSEGMPDVLSDIGEIAVLGESVHWKIADFFNLPQSLNIWIRSRTFHIKGKECELGICPNGWDFNSTEGWFGLFLINRSDRNPNLSVQAVMTNDRGEEICSCNAQWDADLEWYMEARLMERKALDSTRNEIFPDGNLRIFFTLREEGEDQPVEVATKEEEESGDTQATNARTDETRNEEEETQARKDREVRSLEKLSQNLKDLYLGGKDCDLTFKVRERDFKVHRAILRARSLVFDAMFSHDMAENRSGIIDIDDCDPDVFHDFLLFIYTGRVDNLSDNNACGLYYAAEKYSLPELKAECVQFLKHSLSAETICDVVCLAIKHKEAELLNLAINFFGKNLEEILVSVKWQLFMENNPVEANELYIKALKLGYTKKST